MTTATQVKTWNKSYTRDQFETIIELVDMAWGDFTAATPDAKGREYYEVQIDHTPKSEIFTVRISPD